MESKSREQFHAWLKSQGINPPYSVKSGYWKIWQASRSALVVELPPVSDVESDDTDVGYNICHRSVQERLTEQCLAFHVQGSERWITVKGEGDE